MEADGQSTSGKRGQGKGSKVRRPKTKVNPEWYRRKQEERMRKPPDVI